MPRKIDLIGKQFKRLIVTGEEPIRSRYGKIKWLCDCECGNKISVLGDSLRGGLTESCGCLRKELRTIHGMHKHVVYKTYTSMKGRCYNVKNKAYINYGGRGITVCDRWLESIENFIEDMSATYKENLELDRKDNDKGYSKENCRWVTRTQNQRNAGSVKNSTSTYKGVSWGKNKGKWRAGIKKHGRLYYLGYHDCEKEAALAYNKKAYELNGEYAYLNKIK